MAGYSAEVVDLVQLDEETLYRGGLFDHSGHDGNPISPGELFGPWAHRLYDVQAGEHRLLIGLVARPIGFLDRVVSWPNRRWRHSLSAT